MRTQETTLLVCLLCAISLTGHTAASGSCIGALSEETQSMNYGAFPYQGTRLPDPQWAQDVDSTESEDGSFEEQTQKQETKQEADEQMRGIQSQSDPQQQQAAQAEAATRTSQAKAKGRDKQNKRDKRSQRVADLAAIDEMIAEFKVSDEQSHEQSLENRKSQLRAQIAERERHLELVRRRKPGQVQALETIIKAKKQELKRLERASESEEQHS